MTEKAKIGLLACVVAALVFFLSHLLPEFDRFAFEQLLPVFTELGVTASSGQNPGEPEGLELFTQLLLLAGFSAGSILAGRKLAGAALIVVTIQICLLSLVVEVGLFAQLSLTPLAATFFTTICLSSAIGSLFNQLAVQERQRQSDHYELKLRNRELAEARLSLVREDEVERRLLAADLHDQVLNDLKKVVEWLNQYKEKPTDELSGKLDASLKKTMTEIREIMDDLCPVMLSNFGLAAALEDCLEKGRERSDFEIEFDNQVDEEVLESLTQVEQSLTYRLVQESITNICKHARASQVALTISKNDDQLCFQLHDDGIGIDYDGINTESRGLKYMRLRSELIDGKVEWAPGRDSKGTTVTITVPAPADTTSTTAGDVS